MSLGLITLDVYPAVRLLDHMVILLSVFRGTNLLFSVVVATFLNILTTGAQGFQFLHILTNTCYYYFKK